MSYAWSSGGINPYNMYDGWLDSSLFPSKAVTGNYEWLNSPEMDAALTRLARAVTTVQQTAAMEPIARFVAANLRASLGRGARPQQAEHDPARCR
jgi:peptide/nickel transport system substrate-binding protein